MCGVFCIDFLQIELAGVFHFPKTLVNTIGDRHNRICQQIPCFAEMKFYQNLTTKQSLPAMVYLLENSPGSIIHHRAITLEHLFEIH